MNQCTERITFIRSFCFLFKFVMAISRIGMQTHVYVCIFLIWTSNHANIILCVYVRFTFKWNIDCMDHILMMCEGSDSPITGTMCVKCIYIYIYIYIVLGLKSRVVTHPFISIHLYQSNTFLTFWTHSKHSSC